MRLRPATMDDAALLWGWRNDPLTCANSVVTEPVPWERHVGWLSDTLKNPHRELLVAEIDGQPVGTVRIDHGEELSWTVAPDARVRGIGKAMVRCAAFPGAVAQIKAPNIASQKIALHAGFVLIEDGELQRWEVPRELASRAV